MTINAKDTAWALGFVNGLNDGRSPLMASAIDAPMAEARLSAQIIEEQEDDDTDTLLPDFDPL